MNGPGKFAFVVLAILLIIDLYAFRGLRQVSSGWNNSFKIILTVLYWAIPLFITFMTFYITNNMSKLASGEMYYRVFYTFMGVLILFYVPKLFFNAFQLGDDLVNVVIQLSKKLNWLSGTPNIQLLKNIGAIVALLIFVFTFYGIIHGRYHYKVNNIQLEYSNLPKAFDGFRIVQISDWHIGSYYGKPDRIEEAVQKINSLKPDLLVFTGDLVNNLSSEVDEFMISLQKLEAKHGVYSVLGNHDYGEYVSWENDEEKNINLRQLKEKEEQAGFNLLLNESAIIEVKGEKIALVGVENWGLPPFPQHGNLKKAMKNCDSIPFKILLSHDPSHWDAEVKGKTNVDLTLSGHTHGMQFGFILKNFKWSPVKLKYPRWAGLYNHSDQKLYVNVGIGFIGFPGRVGIRPEIAVIELKNI
jgi:predicted MPP superfamily phosphohydrolase